MKTLNLIPGSPEWHAHRNSGQYFNASDAPAMMNASPYETRNALIARLATGIKPEVDAATQRRFDDGHRFEALARPLAAKIIGEELYAVVGVEGNLGASFDGLTMDESIAWEHKRLNEELRSAIPSGHPINLIDPILPLVYRIQMEQQLAVSGATKTLFSATNWDADGKLLEERHCWYKPDLELRAKIIAGWAQLEKDRDAYVPPVVVEAAVAKSAALLPVVLDMRVEGKLVSCNIEQYKPAALAYIAAINTKLEGDQDFADADTDAKYCRESAKKLEMAIELAIGQMGDINTVIATVREIAAAFDAKGLALEKLVKKEKEDRRVAIIQKARSALNAHESSLQERTQHHLKPTLNDFEGVVKNLRTIASLKNAVDSELARCKIEASAAADRITANLLILAERKDMAALFPDVGMLVHKALDDLRNTMTARIGKHEAEEAAKVEALRVRIQQEEAAKSKAREDLAVANALALQQAEQKRKDDAALAATNAEAEAQRIGAIQAQGAMAMATFDAQNELDQQASTPAVGQFVVDATIPKPLHYTPLFAEHPKAAPAPAPDTGERMNLGHIKERIAPFSISAEGLATLGILPVESQGAAKYYLASHLQRVFAAIKGLKT